MRSSGVTVLLLCLAACSANQLSRKSPIAEPEVVIEQTSNVAPAARNITGGITVRFRVRVRNVASEVVKLKRIDLRSIGIGSYTIDNISRSFDVAINPGSESAVEFWAPGYIADPSVSGANGPVTLRAVMLFDSQSGQLQTVVTQQVRSLTAAD
ncbi:MAG TPA: hypothetical protein VG323_03040 [Thermoanaerobaculia bacterium]|nr:hypothetical protein [Thermoanaerobaculia bacterium]